MCEKNQKDNEQTQVNDGDAEHLQGVALCEGEEISPETLKELSNGKGDDDE